MLLIMAVLHAVLMQTIIYRLGTSSRQSCSLE